MLGGVQNVLVIQFIFVNFMTHRRHRVPNAGSFNKLDWMRELDHERVLNFYGVSDETAAELPKKQELFIAHPTLGACVKLFVAIGAKLVAALQRRGKGLEADTASVFPFICFELLLEVLQKTETLTVSFGILLVAIIRY